jgi:Cu+-exporting ATPase
MDKTGTLTLGRPVVEAVVPVAGWSVGEVLDAAGALEKGSEHPLGAAILARARKDELGFGHVTDFVAIPGAGVSGVVRGAGDTGRTVLVGDERMMIEHGVDTTSLAAAAADAAALGRTTAYVAVDGVAAGLIAIGDPVKPESAAAVRQLTDTGIDVWLLTGDGRATADAVAAQVGIAPERVRAQARPADKAALIETLQANGAVVAMVGDGINDAPALAAADLGVAIGTGAAVAVEASDVTLVGGDPRAVASAIRLSRATMSVIRQNLFWAFAYNVVLIPVAMGVLYPTFGITLNPALAAAAMALSSVSVVANSLRLRGFNATADASRGRLLARGIDHPRVSAPRP